jgi:hypothetical protein
MSPPALLNKPEVPHYLAHYSKAFWDISSTRTAGMQLNPIALADIVNYLLLYPWHDVDEFVTLMLEMDRAYLECTRDKS